MKSTKSMSSSNSSRGISNFSIFSLHSAVMLMDFNIRLFVSINKIDPEDDMVISFRGISNAAYHRRSLFFSFMGVGKGLAFSIGSLFDYGVRGAGLLMVSLVMRFAAQLIGCSIRVLNQNIRNLICAAQPSCR
jgi:hypothetical protein